MLSNNLEKAKVDSMGTLDLYCKLCGVHGHITKNCQAKIPNEQEE